MNETQVMPRERTFSWSDPALVAAHLGRRGGLDLLRAMIDGELPPPPVLHMIGMDRMEADEGRVVVYVTPQEFHYNPLGTVHGGVLATLLDTATGCAVHSVLPAGVGYTSLDLTTKFLRPVTVASAELRCEGVVVSRGRTTALAEARMTDGAGRLVAHAISSCLLFEAAAPTG
ncbi:PaaI family thioesterase [Jiangella asiatica]|uniref:Hotdog fold thioesterase n=1 Tax=Jiangella asiatica TaxID=2530372 RepID=A0A4R5CSK8_9ACTN|nr:PaaI family thioesterase [Jiangella asiatica]TDE00775.1 hotdog fold thioesterase [Jiangella asiatica]